MLNVNVAWIELKELGYSRGSSTYRYFFLKQYEYKQLEVNVHAGILL